MVKSKARSIKKLERYHRKMYVFGLLLDKMKGQKQGNFLKCIDKKTVEDMESFAKENQKENEVKKRLKISKSFSSFSTSEYGHLFTYSAV